MDDVAGKRFTTDTQAIKCYTTRLNFSYFRKIGDLVGNIKMIRYRTETKKRTIQN